jgi:hypothetical protein
VLTEVKNAADGGFDGAGEGISDEAMCEDFAFCAIFLRCEGEGYESCSVKVSLRALHGINGPVVDVKIHVSETKWCIIQSGTRVLTRTKGEVECNGDDVGDGLAILCGRVIVCLMEDGG